MLSRLVRRALWLVGVVGVLICALGGYVSVADRGSPGSSWRHALGGVVQAHTLRGDQLRAGPVLVDHRAVWVETGRRLLVRSLDAQGRTRTIFSTSVTPGAPKGTPWPFSVEHRGWGWAGGVRGGGSSLWFCSAPAHPTLLPDHLWAVRGFCDAVRGSAGRDPAGGDVAAPPPWPKLPRAAAAGRGGGGGRRPGGL